MLERPSLVDATSTTRRPVLRIVAGLALMAALLPGSALAAERGVDIVDFGFEPGDLEVSVGDAVTWTNTGNEDHTVTSADGTLVSGTLGPGEAYGHVFETPGEYAYVCDFHPNRMQGTIVVSAAAATPPPSGEVTPSPPSGTLPPNFSPLAPATPGAPTADPTATPAPNDSGAVDSTGIAIIVIAAVLALGAAALLVMRARRAR